MLYFPIAHQEIGRQVASLLNDYNNLSMQRTSQDILNGGTNYVIETHGKFVIGVAGIQKVSHELSELKHLVVHPDWRGKGLGHFVGKRALRICETPSVYATARTTNEASLGALKKLGFIRTHDRTADDHLLAMLLRAAPKWEAKDTAPRLNLYNETNWKNLEQNSPDL